MATLPLSAVGFGLLFYFPSVSQDSRRVGKSFKRHWCQTDALEGRKEVD